MDAVFAGESNIPPEVIDEFLRTGGNRTRSQLRIIYHFMTDPSSEDAAEFIRREYGKGGKGLVIGGKDYCVWFDEAGMKFAAGHSVDDPLMDKAYLSWDDVSGRIRQLLAQGEYAPQSVLDAARGNALREHATALVYMEHDLADGIADIVFEDTSIFEGGFPDAVTKVSEKLDDPAYLADLVERLEGLAAAYAESPDLMSMQGKDFPGRSMPFSSHRRKRTPSLLPGDLIPTDVSRHIPSSSGMRIRRKERNISRISTVPAGGAMPFQVRTTPMPITARKGSSSRGEKQKTLLFLE